MTDIIFKPAVDEVADEAKAEEKPVPVYVEDAQCPECLGRGYWAGSNGNRNYVSAIRHAVDCPFWPRATSNLEVHLNGRA